MPTPLVLVTDPEGRITHQNASVRALCGDCVGLHCCEVFKRATGSACPGSAPGGRSVEGHHEPIGFVEARGVVGPLSVSNVGELRVLVMQPKGVCPGPPIEISPRETEVLRLVAEGYTDPEIAAELGLQAATVRSHVENLRARLSARTRAQAVARAHKLGLLA